MRSTYLFVVASLMIVTLPLLPQVDHSTPADGASSRRASPRPAPTASSACLVTVFVFSLLALAFIGQMPVVAAHNLGINPKSANYGLLYACFGTGALLGAISIGTVFAHTSKPVIVRVCLLGYSVTLAVFALLRQAFPAYFVVAVVGAFYFAFITALNTTMQARLEDARAGAGHGPVDHGIRRDRRRWAIFIAGPVVDAVGITVRAALRRRRGAPPVLLRRRPRPAPFRSVRRSRRGWPSRRRAAASCRACRSRPAGIASVKSTDRGHLKWERFARQKARISSANSGPGAAPGAGWTTALTCSPISASGTPKTATSATAGCNTRTSSISWG